MPPFAKGVRGISEVGYEWFIGLRYMRAKRRTSFISVVTFISVAGITVGVTALIIVLSVMTGFEEDLRSKILGINAHVTVMEFGGAMKDYNGVMKKAAQVEGGRRRNAFYIRSGPSFLQRRSYRRGRPRH